MKHLSASHLEPILKAIASPFDTHQVQRELLRREPHAFASELLLHRDLTIFSNQFARWFDREFGTAQGLIRKTQKVTTPSLAGTAVENQQWEKVMETTVQN